MGQLDAQQHPQRPGAEGGGRLQLPGVDGTQHRKQDPHDQRQRHDGLRDGDQNQAGSQIQRGLLSVIR
ncbi:hypothetical protein [Tessaracoccus coleopterorum]|uniref:hypothetical protein n=1 Tax=Tessaracoccus coleopterorum TaxID=2714950 RepID=UPI002F908463